MFILLIVYALSDKESNLIFYIRKLVILLNKFYYSCNTRVTVYKVIIILLDNCFL